MNSQQPDTRVPERELIVAAQLGDRAAFKAILQKGSAQISDEVARQIQALINEKESRSPAQQKMDSQLINDTCLCGSGRGGAAPSN